MTDLMERMVWPEDSDRHKWWQGVLGIGTGVRECATADAIEQQLAVPVGDDDVYPPAPPPMAIAA